MTDLAVRRRALMALAVLVFALLALAATGAVSARAASQTFQAEGMTVSSSYGYSSRDSSASMGRRMKLFMPGAAVASYPLWAPTDIAVRTRADLCKGAPRLVVKVDGLTVGAHDVTSTTWTMLHFPANILAGTHKVSLSFTNDLWVSSSCERNIYLDYTTFSSSAPAPAKSGTNVFKNAKFWVDPSSDAVKTANAWRLTRPDDAAEIDKIAKHSRADWFSHGASDGTDIYTAVSKRVAQITASGSLPFFVAYYIPNRDCGGYSAGGAATALEYKAWIDDFARALSGKKAAIVLEPDAIPASITCLSATDRTTRLALLKYAVDTFGTNPAVQVYLDAGQSHWRSAAAVAPLLEQAGLAEARGFSLNVSNFQWTGTEIAYGKEISAYTNGKPFVIDTGRNGRGPTSTDAWCNPPGRALGARPTTATAYTSIIDAYLWIHRPGDRDGPCNGAPAGPWWPDYALGLAQRAAY